MEEVEDMEIGKEVRRGRMFLGCHNGCFDLNRLGHIKMENRDF
jgi:hypothetical protein